MDDNIKEINVSNKKAVTLVSECDYEILNYFPWTLSYEGYAGRFLTKDGKKAWFPLAKLVMILAGIPIPEGYVVDHINRNKLDNTRGNLRVVTPWANNFYTHCPFPDCPAATEEEIEAMSKIKVCKYKGVTRKTKKYKGKKYVYWFASICFKGKQLSLGNFPTPEIAARTYDKYARKFQGVRAEVNFPIDNGIFVEKSAI